VSPTLPPDGLAALPPLTEREFAFVAALVQREAGIHLTPSKHALVVGRLGRRVRELGLPSFARYFALAEQDTAERVELVDRITTNETHFYREPRHFDHIRETLVPRWQSEADRGLRSRTVRAWSSACSTGEEPYTLAMILLRAFPPGSGWEVDILASDLCTRVLRQAEEGRWPIEKSRELPPHDLKSFMLRGTGGQTGVMKAGPQLRQVIRFARVNLIEPATFPAGRFDLVFCRNVLIYFDTPTKAGVVGRLLDRLATGGQLFLGHAESLNGMGLDAHGVATGVYCRATDGRPRAAAAGGAP
jgi:chemotaxis protein methyltransferase CheR